MNMPRMSLLIALGIPALANAQEDTATHKSIPIAKFLNLALPAGGLGYKYLGVWDSAYGAKAFAIQGGLFASAVTLLVIGETQPSDRHSETDAGFPFKRNAYSEAGAGFLIGWTASQMWSVLNVNRVCNASWNQMTCSF